MRSGTAHPDVDAAFLQQARCAWPHLAGWPNVPHAGDLSPWWPETGAACGPSAGAAGLLCILPRVGEVRQPVSIVHGAS